MQKNGTNKAVNFIFDVNYYFYFIYKKLLTIDVSNRSSRNLAVSFVYNYGKSLIP
jgi:hypothetical protein